MTFLKVIGITVRLTRSQHGIKPIGDRAEVLVNDRDRLIDFQDEWDVETRPLPGDDAESLEGILDGRAHVIPFDADMWSKAGLPPAAIVGAITAGGKWGNFLDSTAAASVVTYVIADMIFSGAVFTVVYWRFNGATWDHYIKRSDGVGFLNGVRNDAAGVFHTTVAATSQLQLSKDKHDDLAIFPCLISVTHAPLLYAFHNAQALPSFRKLTIEGDLFEGGGQRIARALSVQRTSRPFNNSGTWDPRGAVLTFKLSEAKA